VSSQRSFGRSPRLRARTADDLIDVHDPTAGGLAHGMKSGARWVGSAQVVSQLIRIVMALALTFLIDPAEFGLVALITVITVFFERVLGDTGTTAAVVRHPEITHGLVSSVFWLNVSIGLATSGAFVAFGGVLASVLDNPDAGNLVRVAGLMAFLNAFGHVQRALLRRFLLFRALATVNLSNALITTTATVVLAVANWGPWALVVGNLAGTVGSVALAWWWSPWRPGRTFDRERLRQISRFSVNLSVQNLFGYVSYAGDRFLIGRFIGTAELGYYGLANRLLRYPLQTTTQTYREVVLPGLARIQDDHPGMREAYTRTVNGIAFLLLPLCLGLSALARPLVDAALTDEWLPATNIIAIMALVGALQSLATTTGSIYIAKGRTDLSLRWQMGSSAVLMVAYSIGALWGTEGVAWGYLVGITVLFYPAFHIPLRLIEGRPRDVLSPIAPTLIASAAGAGGAWITARLLDETGRGPWLQLVAGGAVMSAAYGAYVLIGKPQAMRDLKAAVASGRRRGKGAPSPDPASG